MNSVPVTSVDLADLCQLDLEGCEGRHQTLIATSNFEIVHLIVPEGGHIPSYQAIGEVVFHCLQGHLKLRAFENDYEMKTGQLLHIHANALFHIRAYERTSLLVTLLTPRDGISVESIGTR